MYYLNSRRCGLAAAASAFALAAASFDAAFYTVQAIELLAGAANITFLGLNMRDGLKMKGRLRRKAS